MNFLSPRFKRSSHVIILQYKHSVVEFKAEGGEQIDSWSNLMAKVQFQGWLVSCRPVAQPLSKQLVGNNACRWTRCDAPYRKYRVLCIPQPSQSIQEVFHTNTHRRTQENNGKQNSSPAAGIGSCFRERARPCVNDGVCESVEERCLLQAISSAKTQKAWGQDRLPCKA